MSACQNNLKESKFSIIAEIKKASPSAGIIIKDYDPVNIASIYNDNKATCLSVLTEEDFFLGNLIHISKIKQKVNLPILCKDFFVDKFQVYLARSYGADAILIILAGVSEKYEKEWLYTWIKNSSAMIKSGDERAVAINLAAKETHMCTETASSVRSIVRASTEIDRPITQASHELIKIRYIRHCDYDMV